MINYIFIFCITQIFYQQVWTKSNNIDQYNSPYKIFNPKHFENFNIQEHEIFQHTPIKISGHYRNRISRRDLKLPEIPQLPSLPTLEPPKLPIEIPKLPNFDLPQLPSSASIPKLPIEIPKIPLTLPNFDPPKLPLALPSLPIQFPNIPILNPNAQEEDTKKKREITNQKLNTYKAYDYITKQNKLPRQQDFITTPFKSNNPSSRKIIFKEMTQINSAEKADYDYPLKLKIFPGLKFLEMSTLLNQFEVKPLNFNSEKVDLEETGNFNNEIDNSQNIEIVPCKMKFKCHDIMRTSTTPDIENEKFVNMEENKIKEVLAKIVQNVKENLKINLNKNDDLMDYDDITYYIEPKYSTTQSMKYQNQRFLNANNKLKQEYQEKWKNEFFEALRNKYADYFDENTANENLSEDNIKKIPDIKSDKSFAQWFEESLSNFRTKRYIGELSNTVTDEESTGYEEIENTNKTIKRKDKRDEESEEETTTTSKPSTTTSDYYEDITTTDYYDVDTSCPTDIIMILLNGLKCLLNMITSALFGIEFGSSCCR